MTIILQSIFYDMILPNSAAGAVFILLILMFRQVTKRWSKGYVRMLWMLLFAGLLAPPLFHGSFYTIRNLGTDRFTAESNVQKPVTEGQTAGDSQKIQLQNNTPQLESDMQYHTQSASQKKSAGHEAFRQDPYKFASRIIRLVQKGKKKKLAEMIHFPIRVDIDGEETNLKKAKEFIQYYDKIVHTDWKTSIVKADAHELLSNYMGYGLGAGKVWFSEMIGRDGYWIYAINNAREHRYYEESDAQESWQMLAQTHGMTAKEAQQWYVQFMQDDLAVDQFHKRITGCAYEDFDSNGVKDLFLVISLSPHEIYPEYLDATMHVYGYLNGKLVYAKDFEEFSQDGFLQCEAEKAVEDDISCRIRYTVDTDSLKEDQYLLEFDMQGKLRTAERI